MKYRKAGYRYQLAEQFTHTLFKESFKNVEHEYFEIKDGLITVKQGYAWDGPSGPTIDTKNTLMPSMIHDCLYQAIRLGLLPPEDRKKADDLLVILLLETGTNYFRAKLWGWCVHVFAKFAAGKPNKRDIVKEC